MIKKKSMLELRQEVNAIFDKVQYYNDDLIAGDMTHVSLRSYSYCASKAIIINR